MLSMHSNQILGKHMLVYTNNQNLGSKNLPAILKDESMYGDFWFRNNLNFSVYSKSLLLSENICIQTTILTNVGK